jgi:hypothetical protein
VGRRFHVEDPVFDEMPEQLQRRICRGPPHLFVRRHVTVGASEPTIAQVRDDVLVARHQPMIGGIVEAQRRPGP